MSQPSRGNNILGVNTKYKYIEEKYAPKRAIRKGNITPKRCMDLRPKVLCFE